MAGLPAIGVKSSPTACVAAVLVDAARLEHNAPAGMVFMAAGMAADLRRPPTSSSLDAQPRGFTRVLVIVQKMLEARQTYVELGSAAPGGCRHNQRRRWQDFENNRAAHGVDGEPKTFSASAGIAHDLRLRLSRSAACWPPQQVNPACCHATCSRPCSAAAGARARREMRARRPAARRYPSGFRGRCRRSSATPAGHSRPRLAHQACARASNVARWVWSTWQVAGVSRAPVSGHRMGCPRAAANVARR